MLNHFPLDRVQSRGIQRGRRGAHQSVRARGPPPSRTRVRLSLVRRRTPGGGGGAHVDRRSWWVWWCG
ncbi:hypothetical protein EF906_20085 [Streptomyces sp. WAC08241]|nr:hypothetical protein EF906_20085 [Streptomyces sp. WAC08241]